MNMITLYFVGIQIEAAFGHTRFGPVPVSGVGGNVAASVSRIVYRGPVRPSSACWGLHDVGESLAESGNSTAPRPSWPSW